MPYTKAELIDQVYLKVSGGKPSGDESVWRQDIAKYIPAAINFAITGQYWANLKDDRDRDMPGDFVTELELTVTFDKDKKAYTGDLPARLISLPKNRGLRYVGSEDGSAFVPMPENGTATMKYYLGKIIVPQYELVGKNLRIHGGEGLKNVFVRMIISADDVADTDLMPLPAGMEKTVIDLCVEFFLGQRQVPKDYKPDLADKP